MRSINFTHAVTGEVYKHFINDDLHVGQLFRLISRTIIFKVTEKKLILGDVPYVEGISICGRFATGACIEGTLQVESSPDQVVLRGLDAAGTEVWYTGRAGQDFISTKRNDAFTGFNREGATQKAIVLNRGSSIHGVRFSPEN